MGRNILYELTDGQYIRLDGQNQMAAPLRLAGDPQGDNDAVRKAYLDTVFGRAPTDADIAAAIQILTTAGGTIDVRIAAAVAAYLPLAGGTMTGVLTLAGAPVNPLEAATMAYADLMLPLAGGTMGGLLTLSGDPLLALEAATKQYVDALPVGLSTYDAVVAAAGGDYTSIVTACATELAGARIFVKTGTYSEIADIVLKDGQQLVGENPDDTIIDFGDANRKITNPGGCTNQSVEGLTIQGSQADYTVELQGDNARVKNCRLVGTVNANDGVYLNGNEGIVENCLFTDFDKAATYCVVVDDYCVVKNNFFVSSQRGISAAQYCIIEGNEFETIANEQVIMQGYCLLSNNQLRGNQDVTISGPENVITGNLITGADGIGWDAGHSGNTIVGNLFKSSRVNCDQAASYRTNITGNTFLGGNGIIMDGGGFTIGSNMFQGAAFITLGATSSLGTITGNNLGTSTAANRLVDAGENNLAFNNLAVPSLNDKHFNRMKNTSGGGLLAGNCVVLKAVAAGDEFTTTVNQGDDLIIGMMTENIGDPAYGYIQDQGFTDLLKVNGIVDIAIGDLLGTYTTAGIAMKAATGDMAFAIALEAYATDDSAGVIDALLIQPRIVPQHNYAGLSVVGNGVATAIDLVNHLVPITIFTDDMPEAVSNGAFGTYNVTIGEDGNYKVEFHIQGSSAGAAKEYSFEGFCITPTGQAITDATQATPCVVEATGHSFINGDHVKLSGIGGMVELNDNIYVVAAAGANNFALNDENGVAIASGGYGAYSGPGIAELATEISTLHMRRLFGAGGDIGSISSGGIAALVGGETIELFVMNTSDSTDITLVDIHMSMIKV